RRSRNEKASRTCTGNAGHADSQGSLAGRPPRLRCPAPAATTHRRPAQNPTGLPLSCVVPVGAPGAHCFGVGREREQAQGEVLYLNHRRPKATQGGGGFLESLFHGCGKCPPCHPGGVMKIFRRKKFESDMDAELGFHVDAYI